jgi:hypothetical protein
MTVNIAVEGNFGVLKSSRHCGTNLSTAKSENVKHTKCVVLWGLAGAMKAAVSCSMLVARADSRMLMRFVAHKNR